MLPENAIIELSCQCRCSVCSDTQQSRPEQSCVRHTGHPPTQRRARTARWHQIETLAAVPGSNAWLPIDVGHACKEALRSCEVGEPPSGLQGAARDRTVTH